MNMQKFTQKSLEAIQNAQSSAIEYGNPMLDQQHFVTGSAAAGRWSHPSVAAENGSERERSDTGCGK